MSTRPEVQLNFCDSAVPTSLAILNGSDVNKDWTHKDQDKDKDQSHKDKDKDKDLTYKDSKQKRRQVQHSFFKTVSLNVFKKHWNTK